MHKRKQQKLFWQPNRPSRDWVVLQDIRYNARIHPKTRIHSLSAGQKEELYHQIKSTLQEMYNLGGRSTETDLFGKSGGYIPHLSKNTAGTICPRCEDMIKKENYLGGSIYYCSGCQPIQ